MIVWTERFSRRSEHVHLLQINRPNAVAVRGLLIEEGVFETGASGVLMVHEPATSHLFYLRAACGSAFPGS